MGYISRAAAVLLWILGLIITSSVVYLVYSAAVPYLSRFSVGVVAIFLALAWIGILVYWGSVLSHGVSGR